MWELCRIWNAHGYAVAAQELLESDDESLDLGYTLVLKHHALSLGSLGCAVAYLMSPSVQIEIEGIIRNAKAHSLDIERKHQQDKASEGQRVMSVASYSRNSILQRRECFNLVMCYFEVMHITETQTEVFVATLTCYRDFHQGPAAGQEGYLLEHPCACHN